MATSIHFFHASFASVWLGCVITEALFERALLAGGRSAHRVLADLHVRVDKFIELPAILIVLFTGVWLWLTSPTSGVAFYSMLAAGLVAMAANAYCILLVFKRREAAHADEWDEFDRLDHQQHKFGAVVLVGLLAAIVSGLSGKL